MRAINLKKIYLVFIMFLGILFMDSNISYAKENKIFSYSGYPVPRFVSLSSDKVNVRAGPGKKYPIKWVLNRKDLPVEVILEFYNWRKIKDPDGKEGWVFRTLLSGKRTGIILGNNPVYSYSKPFYNNDKKTSVSMYLEPKVIVKLEECARQWCKVFVSGYYGWVERKFIWGVYEHENID